MLKITNVEARRGLLRKFARCFVCLKKGHVSMNCDRKYKCNKCSSRHHISICGNLKEKTSVNVCTNKNGILLQTANAQVSAVESYSFGLVRILFDTGNQRSYVTNDTRARLNLPIIRKETLVIQTFGHYESKLKNIDIVQMKIKGKPSNHSAYVEAICVPEISPLKNQNIEIAAGQHEHLLNLDFADCSEGEDNLEVGVLIGLDLYYSFVSGVVKKVTKGPVAIASCLDWMLIGPYNNLNETSANMITTHSLRAYCEQDETSLTQVMENFWDVDSLGVNNELEVVNELEQIYSTMVIVT